MKNCLKTTTKILAIIALATWLASISMAYTNVWITNNQQITNTGYGWFTNSTGTYLQGTPETSTVDTFPHDQLTSTMWITIFLAIVLTAVSFVIAIATEDEK